MINTLIPNGQAIVFNFPAGSGGKMLQNCVGLSRHCVLNKKEYINWQLNYDGPIDKNFYNQKLQWVLETVPDKERAGDWLAFEIDKDDPTGFNFAGFRELKLITNADYYRLAEKGLWCTVTVHNFGGAEYFNHYWPTIRHVSLVNNEKFGRQSLALKNVHLKFDEEWAIWGFTDPSICFNFDVDNSIYDHDQFIEQLRQLYQYLEFDDFQSELISEYYKKYIKIHL